MIENITQEMASQDYSRDAFEQMRILNKFIHFDKDPKSALLMEFQLIVDNEKLYQFNQLLEKVQSNSRLSLNEILEEAKVLVDPLKKDCLEILKFLLDDKNSMEKKL